MSSDFITATVFNIALWVVAAWLAAAFQLRLTVYRLTVVLPVISVMGSFPTVLSFCVNADAAHDAQYPHLIRYIGLEVDELVLVAISGMLLSLTYTLLPPLTAAAICGRRSDFHSGIGPVQLLPDRLRQISAFTNLVCIGGVLLLTYVISLGLDAAIVLAWTNRGGGLSAEGSSALFLAGAYTLFIASSCAMGCAAVTAPRVVDCFLSAQGFALLLTNLLAATCVAGRGNMLQFVLWFGLGRAIRSGRLYPVITALGIFSVVSVAGPLYQPLKASLTRSFEESADVLLHRVESELSSRAFNHAASRVILFESLFLSARLEPSADSSDWARPAQISTREVKAEWAEPQEASQPIHLLESATFLAGVPALFIANGLLVASLIWLMRISRSLGTPNELLLLFIVYFLIYENFRTSPGMGAIALQCLLIPLVLLATLRLCGRCTASSF